MKIQILGTGCPSCNQLAENAKTAAESAGLDFELVKVTDIVQIAAMGVMSTPALAIDGKVKIKGKVASVEEIKAVLGA
jgi:small redox-active disulfide protein 2